MPAQTVIRLRSGTAAQWASVNPVLAAGEMGVESDTRKFKFGNGTSQWNSIAYASSGGAGGGGFFVAETAPVGANIGDIWYCTADTGELGGKSFIRYDGYWVEINPGVLGPKGDTGATGATGPANTLTVGSVTTLAPGSLATVTITGTAPNQTIDFEIPEGAQGEQGVVAADAPITYNPITQTVGINQSGISITKSQVSDFAHTHLLADITDYVEPDPLPSQTGNAGKYLTTDGSVTSWGIVDLSTKLNITQVVEDKAANYTIVASDKGKILRSTSSSETTFTVADVLNIGESITFFQAGTGLLVVEPASGVTLASYALRNKALGRNSRLTLTKTAASTYTLSGDLAEFVLSAEYLVIAGGGGGGTGWNGGGGGGGAGGYRSSVIGEPSGGGNTAEPYTVITLSTNYTVTVGAGGATQANGSNSVFGTITSIGGGAGSFTAPNPAAGNPGATGGSGGGGGAGQYSNNTGTGGAGTTNQGRAGGNSNQDGGSNWSGGGGGGASAVGSNAPSASAGGNGGAGVTSSITGTAVQRAGGGGGAGRFTQGVGSGGGGNGQIINSGTGQTAGAANTGGGGGGQLAAGGSGVVILRYPAILTITIGAGLTGSTTTVGSSKVTTITAGTGNVSWVM